MFILKIFYFAAVSTQGKKELRKSDSVSKLLLLYKLGLDCIIQRVIFKCLSHLTLIAFLNYYSTIYLILLATDRTIRSIFFSFYNCGSSLPPPNGSKWHQEGNKYLINYLSMILWNKCSIVFNSSSSEVQMTCTISTNINVKITIILYHMWWPTLQGPTYIQCHLLYEIIHKNGKI